jgi:hypothetical protein
MLDFRQFPFAYNSLHPNNKLIFPQIKQIYVLGKAM